MPTITLTNTRTRRKEVLEPVTPGRVGLYLCGPTVYDRAHLGNARPVVVIDVLVRLLRHVYGADAVTYVRNFTDVDDKIMVRAAETGRPIGDITAETIGWYHDDMDALGAQRPDFEPRATAYIGEMQAMIARLIDLGHAYAAAGHVLFDVRSDPAYGSLSGRSLDDMIAGARVEVAPFKRDPMDFVLWKPSTEAEPGWDSPWGRGRPGWHIECSAMSEALLGARFDIHAGGLDLLFPHHENERAQSCCANPGAGFANIWLHNEMLMVDGKKMSKSLGNFFTVRDLLDGGVPGEVIRYVMLMTHYRKPMDWTAEKAEEARGTLHRWRGLVAGGADRGMVDASVVEALADDLNTAGALARLHALARQLPDLPADEAGDARAALIGSARLLGFDLLAAPAAQADLDPLARRFDDLRATARQTKDFSALDALKAALIDAGIEVRMTPAGTELVPGPAVDAAKLKALA